MIYLLTSVVVLLTGMTGALLFLIFDLQKRVEKSERFLCEGLGGHLPKQPASRSRGRDRRRVLLLCAIAGVALVLIAIVAALVVDERPSPLKITVMASVVALSVVLGWVLVTVKQIQEKLLWLTAASFLGLLLSVSASAAIAGHVTLKPTFKIHGETDVHLNTFRLVRFESLPFERGKDCRDPTEEERLWRTIKHFIPKLHDADVIFVVGQVDRRRLARPREEWVRTDLELAQARAACARRLIADFLRRPTPIYVQVGGPSYLAGNNEQEYARDRTVAIFGYISKLDTVSVVLDSDRVRVFPIY